MSNALLTTIVPSTDTRYALENMSDLGRYLLLLAACGGAPTSTPTSLPPKANGMPASWDGFMLGDVYGTQVMAHVPYDKPCDDDPIEDKAARAMVYGGRPCHKVTFPNDTSVVFIIDYAERRNFDTKIRVFGWLGPDDKVKMPIKRGEPPQRAIDVLGPPVASFDLRVLHADVWKDTAVFSDRGQIVGFAFGELPPDPNLERWRVFDQMYRRFTPRPNSGKISDADCLKVLRHATQLGGEDPDAWEKKARDENRLDKEIAECQELGTPEGVACALAAQTIEDVMKCEKK
jgi:hypothetical protein